MFEFMSRNHYLNMLPTGVREPLRKMFDRGYAKQKRVVTPAADGIADMEADVIVLGTGIDLTGFTPKFVGQEVQIICTDSTADATVTCGSGVTFDGTNDVATFGDDNDAIIVTSISLTRWAVVSNVGAVAFS